MSTSAPAPTARPFVRVRASGPFWYAQWWRHGRPVTRALGRAWMVADGNGGWRRRRGRATGGALTETEAAERMLVLVREHHEAQTVLERGADLRRRDGITLRELANEYLEWVQEVKDAKPSTMSGYRYLLREPDSPHRRGSGKADGFIMAALGDRPVASITTREVENVLRTIAAPRPARAHGPSGTTKTVMTQAAPRTVNQHRQLMSAIFNYAMRPSTYGLASNPAKLAKLARAGSACVLHARADRGAGPCADRRPPPRHAGARGR